MLNGFDDGIKEMGFTPEQIVQLNKLTTTLSTGLVDKNTELKNKNKSISEMSASEKALHEASISDYEALKKFKSDSELKEEEDGKNYLDAKQKMEEAHQSAIDKITTESATALKVVNDKITASSLALEKINGEQAITSELVALGVGKDYMEGSQALMMSKLSFVEGKAMIGDKSLSDHIKEWGESDSGKACRIAPKNSGGDGHGSGEHTGNVNINGKTWGDMKTPQEQAAFIKAKRG